MTLADVASVGAGRCAAGHLPAPPDPGVCALRQGPQRASPQLQQNTLSSPRNGARFLQGDVGSGWGSHSPLAFLPQLEEESFARGRHISNVLVNLSGFSILFSTYRRLPPSQVAPSPRGNSCRRLTTDSLSSKETFPPQHFLLKWYFSVTFDLSPTPVKREHGQERSLLPQFQHLGTFIFEKGKGKAALLEAASLGAPGFQRWGEEGLLSGRRWNVRGSVLALRTICLPNQRASFPLASLLCWLLQPGFAQPPWPQGSRHKAPRAAIAPLPLLVLGLCAPLLPLLFLPPGLIPEPARVGVFFLGSHACACTPARKRSGPRPTHLRALLPAPGSRLPAPGSRPAGLSQPRRLRPGWPPGALLSGVAYKGRLLWPRARKASVARFFPHPHEILGLTPPCRRPWASGRVGQRPTTRAEVPLNAPGEWARGELDRYLNEDLRAACWAQSASSRALLLAREGARRRQNAAEARSCSWHPRLSQAVVLKEQ
uniref:uncharacterized protein LOC129502746 n=1 Tax=Nyctereutes procyonoides TaxID=34880 RepID=UPI00244424C5|nr:uncharacterized protein LOC129502746 [Nyctereutes procyonoides]